MERDMVLVGIIENIVKKLKKHFSWDRHGSKVWTHIKKSEEWSAL